MTDQDKRRARYQQSLEKYGESPQSLQWQSYRAAAVRYKELVTDLDVTGKTVLDAGCGMGDLLPYLYAKSSNFTYHGVDITPEFIDIATKRYSGESFAVANPFSSDFTDRYDVILSCGVLNANDKDWYAARTAAIEKLYKQADVALAFNMAGYPDADPENDLAHTKVTYAPTTKIIKFCESLTTSLILRQHYHGKDFTVVLFKD